MTTRSSRLFVGVVPDGYNVPIFTAGQGVLTLLKSVYGFQQMTAPNQMVLKVKPSDAATVAWFYVSTSTDQVAIQWQGWIVMEPGDQILADNNGGTVELWGSGALLPLASQ